MKLVRIFMGLWVRWLILNLLRVVGVVALVHWILQGLYGTPLVKKPLCTATVLHLVLLALLLGILGWAGAGLTG